MYTFEHILYHLGFVICVVHRCGDKPTVRVFLLGALEGGPESAQGQRFLTVKSLLDANEK